MRGIRRESRRPGLRICTALFLASLVSYAALSGCGAQEEMTVFAAVSLSGALAEVGDLFEEREGVALRLNFASSSTLARQIESGAKTDVFLSANVRWMDYLEEKGRIVEESRVDLLGNRLALIVPKGSGLRVEPVPGTPVPEALLEGRIAAGEIWSVPAGIYARQALDSLGWMSVLESSLVACDNVRNALMLVARAEASGGIVYLSDARAFDAVEVAGIFPEGIHDRIVYPAAVLKEGRREAGRALLRFLSLPEASAIFERHGFLVVKSRGRS